MTQEEILQWAVEEGFANAAVVDTKRIPFEPAFLVCCQENLCGKYGVNYACPPDCGTPQQMADKIREKSQALLLQTLWEMDDPMDGAKTKVAKGQHNTMVRRLISRLQQAGLADGFMIGASGCNLCPTCAVMENQPCRFPDQKFSCMSAYCIFVKALAEQCGMEYDCPPGLVALFGMYVFTPPEQERL